MTDRDDIIRMAQASGWEMGDDLSDGFGVRLSRFAALVAAAEREACAKECDSMVDAEYASGKVDHNDIGWTQACAAACRARGQA
jgi:hypothetical protein